MVRVRLGLARAFFLKGEDDELSLEQFERVLAGNPRLEAASSTRRRRRESRPD